ncbi:hypothetical protein CRG98_038746 [Punica granatum]|uniref:Uncharacterized protein n=1 Tax=Punica granatum TaxID=22663 RepID=A0A2I0IA50_PUNGR|nr:hypothetical protein CRG98_038746 [Punica granatum]
MSGDPKSLKQQMLGWSPWKAVKCGHEVRGPEVPKAANARLEPVESSKQMLGWSPWKAVKCGDDVRGPEVRKAANARLEPVESSKVRRRCPGTRSP